MAPSNKIFFQSKFVVASYAPWLQKLEAMPRVQAISGAVVASFVIAFIASKITVMGGERPETNTREWLAKNKIYMQHQKMNPIFGYSKEV